MSGFSVLKELKESSELWIDLFANISTRMEKPAAAHTLLVPIAGAGHINPQIQLGNILASNNIMVTLVITKKEKEKLCQIESNSHLLRFMTLANDSIDFSQFTSLADMFRCMEEEAGPFIENIIEDCRKSDTVLPISTIIGDAVLPFSLAIAKKYGLRKIAFWAASAASLSACLSSSEAIKRAFGGDEGYEEINDIAPWLHGNVRESGTVADIVAINTWDDLERDEIEEVKKAIHGRVLALGPLKLSEELNRQMKSSSCIERQDLQVLSWLDSQKPCSVMYVSFGSIAGLTVEEFEEFVSGLEETGKSFILVMRNDLVDNGESDRGGYLMERCKDKVLVVSWAPQWDVLRHGSVGGFLTHGGWNSVVESLCAGVPVICWPVLVDQFNNARYVCEVWRVGLRLNKQVQRQDVSFAVNQIFSGYDSRSDYSNDSNVVKNARRHGDSAMSAAAAGESSYNNMNVLLQLILGTRDNENK